MHSVGLMCSVTAKRYERVVLRLDHFGELQGVVGRVFDGGLFIKLAMTKTARVSFTEKLDWFEKIKNHDAPDRRIEPRFVPLNPYTQIMWPDGKRETCRVVDLSVSGAAMAADTIPPLGTVLAVGKVIGRVARCFSGGFAVRFVERQDRADVEARVTGAQ